MYPANVGDLVEKADLSGVTTCAG